VLYGTGITNASLEIGIKEELVGINAALTDLYGYPTGTLSSTVSK
jgi:hypothetical protein